MRVRGLAPSAAALALLPGIAEAHLVVTGMGPVYDGATHFALSPDDSLPVLALGLFAGLRGPEQARTLMGVLPAAWFIGGALTTLLHLSLPPVALTTVTALLLLGIGALLAADFNLPARLSAVLAAGLGLARGAADLNGVAPSGDAALTVLGMSATVFVVFALAASISLPLRRFWMIVATRVAGSWLAAVGLLLAGWIIRYGARVQ